ncbi:Nicotinamidase [Phytophthora nicotianae]|uniref:Nicotinamidase n=1 Tax=Phytophthora nicotianae TaxID=4792 RepID=A0A0W8DNP1_PHYNI|nr:Nicotinamidase [Phytophthora nicotianae]
MSDQRCIKEGWLQKRSRPGKLVGNWRRRYFRLTSTELAYYKSPQDVAPRRRYELTLDSSVLRTNDQGYSNCIAFQAAPGQPSFYMLADNEDEKEEWTTAIYNAYRRTPDVAQQPPAPEIPKATPESTPPQPPPPPAPPSRILLKLVVEEARKLKAADMNGKSDPYCIVKLIGKDGKTIEVEEKRTDVISATLEPVWKASFEIGRVVDLNSVKAVRFDLMDHDTLQRHDSLGTVEVPFSRFRMSSASTVQSEPIDEWFRVNPPKKTGLSSSFREKEHVVKDWGELHVKMSITGPNLVDFFHNSELEFVPTSPVATATKEHTDNRLEVTVLAARNLISVDANDSSDPYCELTLLDDNGRPISSEYATTATMHRTRNPTWANEHHVFGLICPIETAASLKVRVVDYDKTNRNDPLGFVIIHLEQLSAHKWTEWHALQPEEGMSNRANLGEIQLKIWLIGERRGEHARRLKIDKELHLKAHSQSVEQLEYENAQIEMYDAACKLDGARIPCAVTDYQARDPRFYGINGCIHYLNSQIPRAHQEKTSTDESFQARTGLEGQALLEVTVIQASDLKQNQKAGDKPSTATPYAVIELDPSVCVEECKRTSAPLSPKKSKRVAAGEARNTMFSKRAQGEVSMHRTKLAKNEMRSESPLEINPDILVLKVEIRTGHGFSPADMNGYSDPYCTLSLTDRTTGKAIEAEKKRTAVMSKTLNPVWTNEIFVFGNVSLRVTLPSLCENSYTYRLCIIFFDVCAECPPFRR